MKFTDPTGYNWVSDAWRWTKKNLIKPILKGVVVIVAVAYVATTVVIGISVGSAVGVFIAGPTGGILGGWTGGILFGAAGAASAIWAIDKYDAWAERW